MSKPTLEDFINDPSKSMERGYYPDFMSVGSLIANLMFDVKGIYKRIFGIIFKRIYRGTALSVTMNIFLNTLKFLVTFSLSLTFFPLFPVWWVIFWVVMKVDYSLIPKRLKEREKRLNKLLRGNDYD